MLFNEKDHIFIRNLYQLKEHTARNLLKEFQLKELERAKSCKAAK